MLSMFINEEDAIQTSKDAYRGIREVKDIYAYREITQKSRDKSIARYEYHIASARAYIEYMDALGDIEDN